MKRWPLVLLLLAATRAAAFDPGTVLTQSWQDLGPTERYRALENYRRYKQAPKERRREVERQYERWRQMPESERERIREKYEQYQSLPPDERRHLNRELRQRQRRSE
jgi:hypothetical protein